jgi:putative transposase
MVNFKKTYKFKVKRFEPLTAYQWFQIKDLIEIDAPTGRPRTANLRDVVDGLRHLVRTGCQWRNTNNKYESPAVLRYYFDKWKRDGTWTRVLQKLVSLRREQLGRYLKPSLGAIDSQSVKIVPFISNDTGIDGNKKINGRKRHIIVDSQGLPLVIRVTAANIYDGMAGLPLIDKLKENYESVTYITADGTYKKTFEEKAKENGITVEITQKPESQQGFVPQKNRWQVERSFSWLSFYRRLSKDYEKTTSSSENMIKIAFISMILNHFL